MTPRTDAAPTSLQDIESRFRASITDLVPDATAAQVLDRFRDALLNHLPPLVLPEPHAIASHIRSTVLSGSPDFDGLARSIHHYLTVQGYATVTPAMVRHADHYCPTGLHGQAKWEWMANDIRQAMSNVQRLAFLPDHDIEHQ